MAKILPVLPRTGQVVIAQESSILSSAASDEIIRNSYPPQPKENFKKVIKTKERYNPTVRIYGDTQRSFPMFINLIRMNLSRSHAVSQQIPSSSRSSLNNREKWQLNKSSWEYSSVPGSRLKHNVDEEISKTRNLKKSEIMEGPSCIPNSEEQKYNIFKEYLHFSNLSSAPVDLIQYPLDVLHISMINRKCSTDQKSAFCCKEVITNVEDSTNKCNVSLESKKYHEFCIDINKKNSHFVNITEYFHQKSYNSSVDWVQTIVYNETNAIIFGQNENAENPRFQTWVREKLQKLSIALALNNHNSTIIFPEQGQISISILLNQWIEFVKSNETKRNNEEIIWQLLKVYQQYDENFSSNLIRICITNQDIARIDCTEQYYYSVCHLNDLNECVDDISTSQKPIICRYFTVDDKKIGKITEQTCDSLDELVIFWDYQRKTLESATGILLLQQIRTAIIHSAPAAAAAAVQLNQHYSRKNVKIEKTNKHVNGMTLKTDGEVKNGNEKIIKASFPGLFKMAETLTEFRKNNYTLVTMNSLDTQMSTNQSEKTNPIPEHLPELNVTTTAEMPSVTIESNSANLSENFDDDALNMTNSDDLNTINDDIQIHTVDGKPFHMDCNAERDEFSATNCSNWANAGYCLSNNATRFLWCRKTCLCEGPQHFLRFS